MQRRAASAYVLLFLVLAAGSYAVIATAQPPEESMNANDAAYTLSQGDTLTINGRTYDVQSAADGTATMAWTNESATYTEVWGSGDDQTSSLVNASITAVDGGYDVSFPTAATGNYTPPSGLNATNVSFNDTRALITLSDDSTATFEAPSEGPIVGASVADNGSRVAVRYFEVPVVSYDVMFPEDANGTVLLRQQLPEDLETIERNGSTYVVLQQDGDEVLRLIEEYQALDRVTVTGSDTLQYRGNATSVSVGEASATLSWQAPRVNTVEAGQAANVTLNGQQFFGYFTASSEISLFENPSGWEAYQGEVADTQYFNERINGFWGVIIMSIIAGVFISALAYLPRKDT
jgi:hypothetical protein